MSATTKQAPVSLASDKPAHAPAPAPAAKTADKPAPVANSEAKAVGRKRAPENETKRERFVRVAMNRLSNVVESLRLLGAMGPSTEYEYTATDIEKIEKTIEGAVLEAIQLLTDRKAKAKAVKGLFD